MALTEEQQDTLISEAASMVQRVVALARRHHTLLSDAARLKPQSPVTWRPHAATAVWPRRHDPDPHPRF